MSNPQDDAARPAKRARLESDSVPTLSANTAPPAPEQPIPSAPAAIDTDLEREVRAGITEYVCPGNLGFTGVLKQRYTDFLVNEIGLDGQVLHLKSTQVEAKKNPKTPENANATNNSDKPKPTEVDSKDEKADTDMQDVGSGEVTLPVSIPAPEGAKDAEDDGEQIIGQVKAIKEEPEETVTIQGCGSLSSVLTQCSLPTRTAKH